MGVDDVDQQELLALHKVLPVFCRANIADRRHPGVSISGINR